MNQLTSSRTQFFKLAATSLVVFFLCVISIDVQRARARDGQQRFQKEGDEKESREARDKFLFVWTGDQARMNPDFLAVVNFDESSADYGKIITTVPLPGPGATGNEPHHVGLSRDGKVLACGGLLSVLRAQKEIDRKSTRLNSSHLVISYAVFCLKKKKQADEQCLGL